MREAEALERGVSEDERAARLSRRAFGILGAGAIVAAGCRSAPEARGDGDAGDPARPEVVILGAGLAGLTCLHRLRARGVDAVVYERAERVGGRTLTGRGLFAGGGAPGRTVELGGEFIDSAHVELMALARELGLALRDLAAPSASGGGADGLARTYFVGGRRVPESQLLEGFVPVARAIREALAAIGDEDIGYDGAPDAAARFDRTSLADFLTKAGPSRDTLAVLDAAYTTEYGIALGAQSSLNLIMMLSEDNLASPAASGAWDLYGDSDERWQIVGGNQRVAEELAARHAARVRTGHAVAAIRQRAGGGWTVSFEGGREVACAVVVSALPFTVLRRVTLDAELPAIKRRVIAELGYGNNGKLILPLSGRPWEAHGEDGALYLEGAAQQTWAPDPWVREGPGVLSNFVGGASGDLLGQGEPRVWAGRLAAALEAVWPGAGGQARVAEALRAHWPSEPAALGSYAGYLVGQWTGIGGAEAEAVGSLIFAGEHTATDFQGYMGGAVESGERAAREVLALHEGGSQRGPRRVACRRGGRARAHAVAVLRAQR